jgi:hypothetical protein
VNSCIDSVFSIDLEVDTLRPDGNLAAIGMATVDRQFNIEEAGQSEEAL